jgi:hypothetical protein
MTDLMLPVKHFSQLDSATDEAMRMCFSSSCSMLAYYLTQTPISGPYAQSDDNYLRRYVERHGDSTDPNAQIAALRDLGVEARYTQAASLLTLLRQLEQGVPVPCGILHHGGIQSPTGGGHWVLVRGMSGDARAALTNPRWRLVDPCPGHLYVNDPAGELDLVAGGYHLTNNGDCRRYSIANFCRRWEAGPPGSYRYTPGTGWAVIASKPKKKG